ncbi:UNVERIFIED_CONTAM: DNA-directed RNA polymerase V subunit [Sesamum calycinum]|uniref:DNA-directed RNA polymerase V subunit n=1 Tax=Sesamum calycinum TaxID=2727403 RepID=A0AAW2R975_9LAMI
MFLRSQLSWNVVIPAQNLDAEGLILQKAILIGLLDEFAAKKASKDIGYFLAVTTLDHIGKGIIRQHCGDLLFPSTSAASPSRCSLGDLGRRRPQNSEARRLREMRNEKSSKIEKGTVVRFLVLAEKYDEAEKDFRAVVSLEGDFLGPIN